MPLLGGAAMLAGGAVAVALRLCCHGGGTRSALPLIATSLAAFGVGLADDRIELAPAAKLSGLALIAGVAGVAAFAAGAGVLSCAVLAASVFFFANAFNLLDNCDGGSATVAAAALAALGLLTRQQASAALAASALGFLVWNWPPARIFMGDAGSLMIGAWCAVCAWQPVRFEPLHIAHVLPVLWVPLYDTLSVIVLRVRRGDSVFVGGQDHYAHRLMRRGMSNAAADGVMAVQTLAAALVVRLLPAWVTPGMMVAGLALLLAAAGATECAVFSMTGARNAHD